MNKQTVAVAVSAAIAVLAIVILLVLVPMTIPDMLTEATTVEIINEGTAPDDASFRPDLINMQSAVTVIWENTDTSAHTVTSGMPGAPTGLFDSKVMGPGDEFEFTFAEEGVFDYYCQLHPAMAGKVIIIIQ